MNQENEIPPSPGITRHYDEYTIAWICALHIERAAALAVLDEVHLTLSTPANDSNTYTLGRIGLHNVVIACLPNAQYGTNNAASVLTNLRRTFPSTRVGLMVGIGGGAPTRADVRLGDVVVGTRVMQYDLGKVVEGGKLHRTGAPRFPHQLLGTAVSALRSKHECEPSRTASILSGVLEKLSSYGRPVLPDRLFQATCSHTSQEASCDECDQSRLVPRADRVSDDPIIHYGAVASGNQVMRSGLERDGIAQELDVVCFEMEAAGLMDAMPCLPIRGICDYSDSHKSKEWQKYASATAAAYATELLDILPATNAPGRPTPAPPHTMSIINIDELNARRLALEPCQLRRNRLLAALDFKDIHSRKANIENAYAKTCQWIFDHVSYKTWQDPARLVKHHGFLWIRGKPGAGKSTMMKFAYSKMKKGSLQMRDTIVASFFFSARGTELEKSITGMYRSLLLQLLSGFPDLQKVLDDREITPKSPDSCPSLIDLKELLRNAINLLNKRSFTCFVDALDECDEQQVMDMVQYFEDLAEDSINAGISFRICFSSRHYPYIDIRRGIRVALEDLPEHLQDLTDYVRRCLRIKNPRLVEELRTIILKKAAGVFLWVVLVVKILNKEYRQGGLALKRRLAEIPDGLTQLFRNLVRRDDENMERFLLCIVWILFSVRPLSSREYYHAVWSGLLIADLADDEIPPFGMYEYESEEERAAQSFVASSSKGLAEVSRSGIVQFIHESVHDFLIRDQGLQELWPDLGFSLEGPSHEKLKQCCTTYLNHPSVQVCFGKLQPSKPWAEFVSGADKFPFLQYANEHRLDHSEIASRTISQVEFLNGLDMRFCIRMINAFTDSTFDIDVKELMSEDVDILYFMAANDFSNLIRILLKENPLSHPFGRRPNYPVITAIVNNHCNALVALLEWNSIASECQSLADDLIRKAWDSETQGRTPLTWAAQYGNTAAAKHFIQQGMPVDGRDEYGMTALSMASYTGCERTARVLIEGGADVNMRAAGNRTPLVYAFLNSNIPMMRILIESGADTNSLADGVSLLARAARRNEGAARHEGAVRMLVEGGADVDASDEDGRTPLMQAISYRNKNAMEILIEGGADINMRDGSGLTPLMLAKRDGNAAIVEVLIKNGALE